MTEFILGGPKILEDADFSQEINRHLLLGRKSMIILDSVLLKKKKKKEQYFAYKGLSSQSYGFSSSYIWMQKLDYK